MINTGNFRAPKRRLDASRKTSGLQEKKEAKDENLELQENKWKIREVISLAVIRKKIFAGENI